jgi:sugar phosphate isomerase/epimerase
MKFPQPFFLQGLAFAHLCYDEDALRSMIRSARKMGYGGLVIVAALIDKALVPKEFARIFKEMGMKCIVCGFNPGDGPNPLDDNGRYAARDNLAVQAKYAAAIHDAECGPAMMVGPMHVWHGQKQPGIWDDSKLTRWAQTHLFGIAEDFGLTLCIEGLNGVEDKTPQPIKTMFWLVRAVDSPLVRAHLDTGHAAWHDYDHTRMAEWAPLIGYMELVNGRRQPCDVPHGIDFPAWKKAMAALPESCHVGCEPFDELIVKTFKVGQVADELDGLECAQRDADYFGPNGLNMMLLA